MKALIIICAIVGYTVIGLAVSRITRNMLTKDSSWRNATDEVPYFLAAAFWPFVAVFGSLYYIFNRTVMAETKAEKQARLEKEQRQERFDALTMLLKTDGHLVSSEDKEWHRKAWFEYNPRRYEGYPYDGR